jgi:hypothetical protein
MSHLSFEPLISLALWLTLAVAGAGLLVWYAWKRPGSLTLGRWVVVIALMGIGTALVLFILLNPTWIEPVPPPPGKPVVTILVDDTASMATTDMPQGKNRFQAAVATAQVLAEQLKDQYEVTVAVFDGQIRKVESKDLPQIAPTAHVTDLAVAVAGTLEEQRPQGQAVVILSDGIHNGGGGTAKVLEAVQMAKAMNCPVFTRTLGGEAQVQDVAVEVRSPQELAFLGQKVPATIQVRQRGYNGRTVQVILSQDGKELERKPLTFQGTTAEIQFQLKQDTVGLYRYEVKTEPLPGEISLANNQAAVSLRVVDKPVRVLVLEGKPYWDAKFLLRTMSLDLSTELDSITKVADARLHRRRVQRGTVNADPKEKTPPATVLKDEWNILPSFDTFLKQGEGLKAYQILVLGRDADLFLTEDTLALLKNWIARDGGCLVCYRGQPTAQMNQKLGALLPVKWQPGKEGRFQVALTERGKDLQWLPTMGQGTPLERLPTLASAQKPENPGPLAVVLATGGEAGQPVLTYQPYGSGKVVVIEGAGMWRWAFLPPQQQELDEVYQTLWHNLLRWLVSSADLLPGQKLALRSDKISFSTQEPATATLILREEAAKGQVPRVVLEKPEANKKPVVVQTVTPTPVGDEPGTFRVVFGKLPEGRYLARVEGSSPGDFAASAVFDVRSLFEEQLDLQARPDLMKRIADDSGGAVLTGDTPEILAQQLQKKLDSTRSPRIRRLSAWDNIWIFITVLGVWGIAWSLRRSGGLV